MLKNKNLAFKAENWQGMININMAKINSKTIFHELNHAAQNIIEIEEYKDYSEATKEVETRMILFYSAFSVANEETRSNREKMRLFLHTYYCNAIVYDLYPLIGVFYTIGPNDITHFYDNPVLLTIDINSPHSFDQIYQIVYEYFSNKLIGKEENVQDFNNLMQDYAKWIKENFNYTYSPDDFESNYFLLKKLQNH